MGDMINVIGACDCYLQDGKGALEPANVIAPRSPPRHHQWGSHVNLAPNTSPTIPLS